LGDERRLTIDRLKAAIDAMGAELNGDKAVLLVCVLQWRRSDPPIDPGEDGHVSRRLGNLKPRAGFRDQV
jgi:hypothetical protein